jgi:hypothetical protein
MKYKIGDIAECIESDISAIVVTPTKCIRDGFFLFCDIDRDRGTIYQGTYTDEGLFPDQPAVNVRVEKIVYVGAFKGDVDTVKDLEKFVVNNVPLVILEELAKHARPDVKSLAKKRLKKK